MHATRQNCVWESDKDSMRKWCFSMVFVSLAAAGPARADSLQPTAGRCAGEISALRGVWRPRQVFLPAYADLELVLYMASLGAREPGVAVVPVLSSEPLYFRSKKIVFISTGFILQAGSERELEEAIRTAPVEVQTRDLPACAAVATFGGAGIIQRAPASFPDVRLRLAGQLAGYEDVTVRRLRKRDTGTE